MASRFHLLAASAVLLVVFAGCEATDPVVEDPALLGIELQPRVGDEVYDPSQVYTVNGLAMMFAAARVYVSNVRLVREDGSEYLVTAERAVTLPAYEDSTTTVPHTVNEAVAYAALDEGTFEGTLGEVPAGNYRGIRFDVGLAGRTNHVDVTQAPAGHPLALQDLGNYWGWAAGYIFLRTDGRVDTDGNGSVSDATDADWNVHLGTDGYLIPVELEEAFEIEAGGTPALHIRLDLAHLLEGVDLGDPAQRVCHTMNNVPVADAVREHTPDAFEFHGLHSDGGHD